MSERKALVLLSDPAKGTTAKASSVLQKNSKLYGPMNALDLQNASTCWNSDGSKSGKTTSTYALEFGSNRMVQPVELRLQYQAGFAAEQVTVYFQRIVEGNPTWEEITELEIEDDHHLQCFPLLENQKAEFQKTNAIKMVFDECTDFYGRVTIYQLQVWGHEVD